MTRIGQILELSQIVSKLNWEWPWTFRTLNFAFSAQVDLPRASWTFNYPLLPTSKNWPKIFFSRKNGQSGFGRNFYTLKSTFLGWGWAKFFRPAPMRCQSLQKKILVLSEPFWGYGGLSESKTAEITPKNAILQKFLHPQNRPFWGGVVEKFSARTKGVPKPSKNILGDI